MVANKVHYIRTNFHHLSTVHYIKTVTNPLLKVQIYEYQFIY